jgi:hypothetical protein
MDITKLEKYELVYVPSGHPFVKERVYHLSQGKRRGFFLLDYGVWCPFGEKDIYFLMQKLEARLIVKPGSWVFLVIDEKRWMLTKIKYAI